MDSEATTPQSSSVASNSEVFLILNRFFRPPWLDSKEGDLYDFFKKKFGIRIGTIELYKEAFRHKSFSSPTNLGNNERLEFLGDAILSSCVSVILYTKYPEKTEGELTKLRSRIVNRKHLNQIAKELGIIKFIKHDERFNIGQTSVAGNTLEAVLGAIYLDHGYEKTETIIQEVILHNYSDLKKLEKTDENFKSILLEWSQSKGVSLSFDTKLKENSKKLFSSRVMIDNGEQGFGEGRSKKEAEQNAAKEALSLINKEAKPS